MTQTSMHPFAEDRRDFDRLGARTAAMIGEYLRNLPVQPVDRVVPADVRRRLMSQPLPEKGRSPEEILDFLKKEIFAKGASVPWMKLLEDTTGEALNVRYYVEEKLGKTAPVASTGGAARTKASSSR